MIGLNAQLFGTGTAEEERQFRWLGNELRSSVGPLGLMLHKPLFRNGPEDCEPHVRYVPEAPRRRLLAMLRGRELRFVLSGHAHQTRQFLCGGVEHRWAPSTAFCLPDGMQERIGEKEVGILTLALAGNTHLFTAIRPEGLIRHNILDHPQLYPGITALRIRSVRGLPYDQAATNSKSVSGWMLPALRAPPIRSLTPQSGMHAGGTGALGHPGVNAIASPGHLRLNRAAGSVNGMTRDAGVACELPQMRCPGGGGSQTPTLPTNDGRPQLLPTASKSTSEFCAAHPDVSRSARKVYPSIAELQADLDSWALDAMPMTKEKMIAA
jgi:hypothetical protein